MNYYNEHDPHAAEWLRELIRGGHIPPGDIDTRDIQHVWPTDLLGYVQCHFFAGIGGWPLALRLAGWPEDRPVWTGSCPCQPFSVAGKRRGTRDARHLWPVWLRLIAEGNGLFGVPTVFGEQVASADGRVWLSGVRSSLEALGYRVGGADLCAAGVGAPHIRQRLFWVADSGPQSAGRGLLRSGESLGTAEQRTSDQSGGSSRARGLADVQQPGLEGHARHGDDGHEPRRLAADAVGSITESRGAGGVGQSESERSGPTQIAGIHCEESGERRECVAGGSGSSNFWSGYDLLPCADGKARRVEPGTFPLAHGVSGRVGLLRGYGNAIVPQVAAQFIQAYRETLNETP